MTRTIYVHDTKRNRILPFYDGKAGVFSFAFEKTAMKDRSPSPSWPIRDMLDCIGEWPGPHGVTPLFKRVSRRKARQIEPNNPCFT